MNKRSLVIVCGVVVLAIFALAAYFYPKPASSPSTPPVTAIADTSGLVRAHSPILGPVDAPVTLVEFLDPSCEACRMFFPYVEDILAKYPNDLRLVIRYAAFHPGSSDAVRILEAARMQDKYKPVLEALFAQQPAWAVHGAPDLDKAWEIAGAAGLDIPRAKNDARNSTIVDVLNQDADDIRTFGVRQTPTFFLNGKPVLFESPEQLLELITSEVEKASPRAIEP